MHILHYFASVMVSLSQSAVDQLRALLAQRGLSPAAHGLRLLVEKGGCAGLSYAMKIDSVQSGDHTFETDGVRLFVPDDSLPYLKNCEIDFVADLHDSGFKIRNPDAVRSCGCGTSFEPTAAADTTSG